MRKAAGTVVALVVGLACSACGSAHVTTTTNGPRTVSIQLPVSLALGSVSGTGSKTLHAFTVRGNFATTLTCTGAGTLDLEFVPPSPSLPGLSTTCPETGSGLGPGAGSGHRRQRVQIMIHALAHVHWTVSVREVSRQTLTAPARVQRLPVHRRGVGSTLLGVFAVRGSFYVKGACLGTGTFGVYFGGSGSSTVCPDSLKKPAVIAGESGDSRPSRVRIWVRAPAGMKWTLTVAEGRVP